MNIKQLKGNESGFSPAVGVSLMLVIVFIIAACLFSSLSGFNDNTDSAPLVNFQASSLDESTLKIEHLGGDPFNFDPSSNSLILEVGETSYLLDPTELGNMETGDTKIIHLNEIDGSPLRIPAEEAVTLKIVDLETRKPVFTQKLRKGVEMGSIVPYKSGLLATYYDNINFNGVGVVQEGVSRIRFADKAGQKEGCESDEPDWPHKNLPDNIEKNEFSVVYEGYLWIDKDDEYTFILTSDDGSWLTIDNSLEIDNGGYHNLGHRNVTIFLKQGYHPIECKMFEGNGEATLHLEWETSDSGRCFVTGFYH